MVLPVQSEISAILRETRTHRELRAAIADAHPRAAKGRSALA